MSGSSSQSVGGEAGVVSSGIVEVHPEDSTFVAVRPVRAVAEEPAELGVVQRWVRSPALPQAFAVAMLLGLVMLALTSVSPLVGLLVGGGAVAWVATWGGLGRWRR